VAHDITWEKKGVTVCLLGEIDIHEINKANGELHGDSRFDEHKFQIRNFLEADLSSIPVKQAAYLAAIDLAASRYAKEVKVAIVTKNKHSIEFSKKYIERSKKLSIPWQFSLFDCMGDAIKWGNS
jgi:hypothetical protein